MRGFFDLLIADEVHEFKGRGSAQGIAAGILADACGRSLTLTGTLLGGYASTLFHLLYRFSPEIRTEFGRSEEGRWISRYGFLEETVRRGDDGGYDEDGRSSRRRRYRKTVREKPGLAPAALFHLIGHSVFLRLYDVASDLPPYEEQVLLSSMDSEPDATELSQRKAYDKLFDTLRAALTEALAKGSKRLLATYLQSLLAYPDGCTRGETAFDPTTGDVLVQIPPLSEERLYPKEKALLDLVAAERLEGRRVLVYATHTGTRDVTGRMSDILTRHGFKVVVMKADAVAPDRREAWVAERVKEGIDVLICHPRLVQTGLYLVDFPTICWMETDIALWDIKGKPLGRPVYDLLGGPVRDNILLYTHPQYGTPEVAAESARKQVEEGFTALKTDPFWEEMGQYHTAYLSGTISRRGEERGAEIIAAIREAVGPEVEILIDCHGNFNVASAIRCANTLAPYNIGWFEEPVPPREL